MLYRYLCLLTSLCLLPPFAEAATPTKPPPIELAFKPGKGLEVRSRDGAFALRTRLRGQLLYSLMVPTDGESPTHSFQLRRARLAFTGNVFGKHNEFKVEIAISPRDLDLDDDGLQRSPLLDWYAHFSHLRDLTLRLGQYKVPYSRERVISSGNLTFVDRSIVNREFNLDRDLGLDIRSKDLFGTGYLRYYLGIYMGEGHSSFAAGGFGMMYIARLEVTPLGRFKDDYSEGDLRRHSTPKLSIGAAYAFVDDAKGNRGIVGNAPADGGTTDTHNVNVDAIFKWRGLGFSSGWMWRKGQRNPGTNKDAQGNPIPTEKPRDGMGIYAQVSYLLPTPTQLQLALRYSHIRPLPPTEESSLGERNALGGGLSYYFADHPFKLQVDYFYLWGEALSPGEHRVRAQLQLSL